MENKKRYSIKNILATVMWIAIASGSIVLLIAAVKKKDSKICKGIEINISGVSNNFFIDNDDVHKIIDRYSGKSVIGKAIEDFDLIKIEAALKKDIWIKNAELFFDNNEILQADVEEREPVARIFTTGGSTFYIDSSNLMLPLSDKLSARVPVFTNFPSEARILNRADSFLLNDIKKLSLLIQADPFLMAMIEQVDITWQQSFEMIPKLGNQMIVFGDASDAALKFSKLQLFYKKVMMKVGWNKYSVINLQYKNQIVAKIKGKEDVQADSLRTIKMMEIIAANASRNASDSARTFMQDDRKNNDSSMIEQSMQRDDIGEVTNINADPKPLEKQIIQVVKIIPKPAVKPVEIKKPVAKIPVKEKPKMVMPKRNDY